MQIGQSTTTNGINENSKQNIYAIAVFLSTVFRCVIWDICKLRYCLVYPCRLSLAVFCVVLLCRVAVILRLIK